jgi:predicted lipid-binding transport protein (Tim44 family)
MSLSELFIPFLARAGGGVGGGGHSSSGGSHISSSGGSHISSSGFSHTYVGGSSVGTGGSAGLAILFVFVPIILIVVIFGIFAVRAHRRSKHAAAAVGGAVPAAEGLGTIPPPGAGSAAPTSLDGVDTAAVEAGLSAIREHDPGFDEDAFLAEVERSFFAVEEAWNQQRPEVSRPVMTEEAWEHQKAEIESYRNSGRRNVLDNLTVAKATILAASSEDGHDVVTVRFRAASANYDVNIASGKVVHGNHQMAFWEQDWVFQRSIRATSDGDSTSGQRCPNCGAPLDVDIAGVCRNCKSPVRSGDNAWVVVRAGQPQHVPS